MDQYLALSKTNKHTTTLHDLNIWSEQGWKGRPCMLEILTVTNNIKIYLVGIQHNLIYFWGLLTVVVVFFTKTHRFCPCTNVHAHTWFLENVWALPTESVHRRTNPGAESRPPSVVQSAPDTYETTGTQIKHKDQRRSLTINQIKTIMEIKSRSKLSTWDSPKLWLAFVSFITVSWIVTDPTKGTSWIWVRHCFYAP